jgi:hypothetical protein
MISYILTVLKGLYLNKAINPLSPLNPPKDLQHSILYFIKQNSVLKSNLYSETKILCNSTFQDSQNVGYHWVKLIHVIENWKVWYHKHNCTREREIPQLDPYCRNCNFFKCFWLKLLCQNIELIGESLSLEYNYAYDIRLSNFQSHELIWLEIYFYKCLFSVTCIYLKILCVPHVFFFS